MPLPTAVPSPSLIDLGWDDGWASALADSVVADSAVADSAVADSALAAGADLTVDPVPGRVSRIDRGISTVVTEGGRVRVPAVADVPIAVGDWVTLVADPAARGHWTLSGILPRRSAFQRTTDDPNGRVQVVAANIDTVFLVDAMDGQLSVRHLERYVALAWQSGAVPVVVVTKADLASPEEVRGHVAAVAEVALDVAVHVLSATTGEGLDSLAPYVGPGRTVALLGLSGAGKSTLVNLLVGDRLLATGAVRGDGKGRHTTTHRELVAIPGGGLLIDTPGMRALSVSTAATGVAQVFSDVEDLGSRCAFPDCSHTTEPGCAIVAAVAAGELSATRLASWRQLLSETRPEDPSVLRHRIVERKRQKATAKASRARARAIERKPAPPPHG